MNGKVLIPLCRGRVAPLFDTATDVALYSVHDGKISHEEEREVNNPSPAAWCLWLEERGVTHVICSAISRPFSSRIHEKGIELIPGIRGECGEVIRAWLRNDLTVQGYLMPGCRWRRHFRDGTCPRYREILSIYEKNQEVDPMKIAISTEGNELSSPVDARFGRARGFIIYDIETGDFVYKENSQNLNAPQGAGIQSAKNVIDAGAGALISGHVGPKAFTTLNSAGVKIYTGISGTVADVIEKYKSGDLSAAAGADVEGHW